MNLISSVSCDGNYSDSNRGFSLIELMVTVSVIAILSLIASSSFQSARAKSNRSLAMSDMHKIAQALERYYTFNRVYTQSFSELSLTRSSASGNSIQHPSSLYQYTINLPEKERPAVRYIIYAAPLQNNVDTWVLSLNESGFRYHYPKTNFVSSQRIDGWP